MEEKNNTPNKLDFISKFRAQYQVPKNVPNEMVEFFPSFEHAWAGWCMACPSQPTQSMGLTDEQISKMWSDAGVEALRQCGGQIGGVDAAYNLRPLIFARAILARHTTTPASSATSGEAVYQVASTIHPNGWFDCTAEDLEGHQRAGFKTRILYAHPAAAPDSAQQGEPLTYTVDGVVMPQLEYIDYLHGQLDEARTAANVRKVVEVAESTNPAVELLKEKYAKQGDDEPPLPWMAEEYAGDFEAWLEWHDEEALRKEFLNYARTYHAHMMRKLGDGVSVDTPEFWQMIEEYCESGGGHKKRQAILDFIALRRAASGAEVIPVGTLAWALIQTNGNIIIWSRNRSTVEGYQSRYPTATLSPIIGAAGAERAVPEDGLWPGQIEGDVPVHKLDLSFVIAHLTNDTNFDGAMLERAWNALLAAAPSPAAAKEGWKPLADDDKPDVTRKIDVVLTNGVTLENGDYRKIDWTQVRNWRYSPTQQTSAKVDAEGGEA